jgi:hypothetical protein
VHRAEVVAGCLREIGFPLERCHGHVVYTPPPSEASQDGEFSSSPYSHQRRSSRAIRASALLGPLLPAG